MGDDDDLPVIELSTDAPPPRPPRPRRGDRRRIVALVTVAALAAVAVGVVAITRPRQHAHRASSSAPTIRLPIEHGSGTTIATTPVTAADSDAEFIGRMHLVAPGVGWALNGYALYRTTDNGENWQNITPPHIGDPIGHIVALTFLDADHAWVIAPGPGIVRTVDGGRSWVALHGHFCTPTVAAQSCAPAALDFVDAQRGWAVVGETGGSGRLLATRDGGSNWSDVGPTPFAGRVQFISANEAWGVNGARDVDPGGSSVSAIFHTTDGGRTWRRVPIPTNEGTAATLIDAPFFAANTVIAAGATRRAGGTPEIVVSITHDGGTQWTRHTVPLQLVADSVALSEYRFSAASASDWALAAGPYVHVTHDAGLAWTPEIPTGGTVHDVQISPGHGGWILADNRSCTLADPDTECPIWLLYRMTFAAQVWDLASPEIGVTANRSP